MMERDGDVTSFANPTKRRGESRRLPCTAQIASDNKKARALKDNPRGARGT